MDFNYLLALFFTSAFSDNQLNQSLVLGGYNE